MAHKRHRKRNPRPPRTKAQRSQNDAPQGESVATGEETRQSGHKTKELPPAFLAQRWKPGQSGNPNGRPRKLTDELNNFLDRSVPGDPEKRKYYQLMVEAFVKRAITKSDVLMKEAFDRIEGRVSISDEEAEAIRGVRTIILDVPRPDRRAIDIRSAVIQDVPSNRKPAAVPADKPDPRPKD